MALHRSALSFTVNKFAFIMQDGNGLPRRTNATLCSQAYWSAILKVKISKDGHHNHLSALDMRGNICGQVDIQAISIIAGRHGMLAMKKQLWLMEKSIPAYAQKTMESLDGFSWDQEDHIVFPVEDNKLLGYGRPAIWFDDAIKYQGLFSERNWGGSYTKIKYGTSSDGYKWAFQPDSKMNFNVSNTCDSQNSVCFPSIIFQEDRILMFYNGDDFGREGLRLAIWNENLPA